MAYPRDEGGAGREFVGHSTTRTTRDYARSYISLKTRQRVVKKADELRTRQRDGGIA